jgi:hypothetical protein
MTAGDAAEELLEPLDPFINALGDVGDWIHVVPGDLDRCLHI